MAPKPPASLLPVFIADASSGEPLLLYQRIDNAGNVTEFLVDPDLRIEHLVRTADYKGEEINIRTGEKAIHAYEIDSTEIIVAPKERFKDRLRELLKDREMSATPFAGLELARYVEDAGLEEDYAIGCAIDLAKRSPRLAVYWTSAARLSPSARRAALDAAVPGPVVARDKNRKRGEGKKIQAADVFSAAAGDSIWLNVKKRLRADVGEDVYTSWFSRMNLEGIDDDVARLSVPSRFIKSWIQSHYAERVVACMQEEGANVSRIEVLARSVLVREATPAKFKPAEIGAPQMFAKDPGVHEALGGSPLDTRLSFESFVVGRSNTLAHAAAKQVAAARRTDPVMFNPLYIHAGVGLGKTHLLQAITWAGNAAGERKVLYLTAEKFMYGFVSALRTQTALAFKEALRGIGVLVIDDLQFLQGKSTQAEFCHTLNALIDAGRQVVIASDRPPSELETFEDRVRSRLGGGLVVEMGSLGEELRFEILKARVMAARSHHPSFDVPLPVLTYIAKTVTHNGRDLEGALNRLLAHNKLTGQSVTLEMAEREVRDLIRPQEPKRVKIEDIQRVVARQYNVSRSDLLSSRRTANVVRPRQVAMYLAKTLTLRSLPEIGRRFGGRDHTTVLHAVRKIEGLVGNDMALAEEIEILKRQLQE
jgi:chromosomal replication initiator protein